MNLTKEQYEQLKKDRFIPNPEDPGGYIGLVQPAAFFINEAFEKEIVR